jgi:hypothetical protein
MKEQQKDSFEIGKKRKIFDLEYRRKAAKL